MKGDESPKVSLKKARSTLVTWFMFGWFASRPLLKVRFPKETCRKYGARLETRRGHSLMQNSPLEKRVKIFWQWERERERRGKANQKIMSKPFENRVQSAAAAGREKKK
jgi:hypothetical protein